MNLSQSIGSDYIVLHKATKTAYTWVVIWEVARRLRFSSVASQPPAVIGLMAGLDKDRQGKELILPLVKYYL